MKPRYLTMRKVALIVEAWSRGELVIEEVVERIERVLIGEGVITQPVPPDQRLGPAPA